MPRLRHRRPGATFDRRTSRFPGRAGALEVHQIEDGDEQVAFGVGSDGVLQVC